MQDQRPGREVQQGMAVGGDQEILEGDDETQSLLGRSRLPVRAQDQATGRVQVELRSQQLHDQCVQGAAVGFERIAPLGHDLDVLAPSWR